MPKEKMQVQMNPQPGSNVTSSGIHHGMVGEPWISSLVEFIDREDELKDIMLQRLEYDVREWKDKQAYPENVIQRYLEIADERFEASCERAMKAAQDEMSRGSGGRGCGYGPQSQYRYDVNYLCRSVGDSSIRTACRELDFGQ